MEVKSQLAKSISHAATPQDALWQQNVSMAPPSQQMAYTLVCRALQGYHTSMVIFVVHPIPAALLLYSDSCSRHMDSQSTCASTAAHKHTYHTHATDLPACFKRKHTVFPHAYCGRCCLSSQSPALQPLLLPQAVQAGLLLLLPCCIHCCRQLAAACLCCCLPRSVLPLWS